jgi:Domain of unknown function (DUF4867)
LIFSINYVKIEINFLGFNTIVNIFNLFGGHQMIKTLSKLNPELKIYSIYDKSFCPFGKIIDNYDFSDYIRIMHKRPIPTSGNIYLAADEELMNSNPTDQLSQLLYGGVPIQVGYCNGNSNALNALEYHKCHEVNISITDMILLLGDIRGLNHNTFPSSKVTAFYLPANTACELYSTTLHFAPCKISDEGFKSIVILPEKTNANLHTLPEPGCDEDILLWKQNKWLIAHPDSSQAEAGAYPGITGCNIKINYK